MRLKREQRKLSNCKMGSNNRHRQGIRVAKLHEKVANQRMDFLHKLSRQITNEVTSDKTNEGKSPVHWEHYPYSSAVTCERSIKVSHERTAWNALCTNRI
jgi:hypothetical protein